MVLPAPAQLPTRALAALVAAEGLGDLHVTLAPVAVWRSDGDPQRAELVELLTALGWRDRAGRLEREVASTLAVLCRPSVEFYGWLTHHQETIAVLAARIGREGVLAVRRADSTVRLRNIHSGRLAERLLAQAPDIGPGRAKPVTFSPAEVRVTDRTGRQRTAGGVGVRRAGPEVRQARALVTLPTTGAGELYVAVRDDGGRQHADDQPVTYVDSADGRYVERAAGRGLVSIRPATAAELVTELRARHRRLV